MHSLRDIFTEETAENYRTTDKNRGRRSHLGLYEILFEPYRHSATKVFEIGVNKAGSIKAWRRYFSSATVYGIDIREKTLNRISSLERVVPVNLDQGNSEQLEDFAKNGPFDIGIDDGSHIWKHQILTFEKLWPAIKPGGLYVIEDVSTSYENYRKHNNPQFSISCINYFKHMIDEINFYGEDIDRTPKEVWHSYQKTIDWICFRSNAVFLRKRITDFDPNSNGE
ncbi:MAG: hypothetical protein ACFFBP_20950 [Promethearchaeota archaeon]